jgi:hypothetical protein
VVPSASRALVAVLALGGVTACDSTQNKNERAKLGATRILESRKPQRVTQANPNVAVTDVALVRGRRSAAIVVELRSRAAEPLTDVPIAVGVGKVTLNERRRLDWFQTHVPAIPAGGSVTWVFETRRPLKRPGRPFARVGVPQTPPISHAQSLPTINASSEPGGRVVVENDSDVPQYGLQVYALARDGGRYVAAGKASLEHLGTGGSKTVRVPLTGRPEECRLTVHAIPTIFQ